MRLVNASGCLDALTAPEAARSLDAYVSKTVTPLPRDGNEAPRIAETQAGLLNSIGLPNPGVDVFARDVLPRLAELGVPVWVSAGGFCASDFATVCEILEAADEVAAIELNLSCPNVDGAPESAAEVVRAARAATCKPLLAKLSAAPDVAATAVAVQDAGADALSLVNTIRGLALDARTLRPRLAHGTGGLSGPALRPVALAAVYECRRATSLPIVGIGGVWSGSHVVDLLAAGAETVALGTVLFDDPGAPARVRAELRSELRTLGVASPDDIIGAAHPSDALAPSRLNRRSRVLEVVA
jgi:dihydroorotate dehydrogenase (NAD+) catalytic subunit